MTSADRRVIGFMMIALGSIIGIIPVYFWWWIRDFDRYYLMIHGPAPFSYFGSAPIQLLFLFIAPILTGVILISFGIFTRHAANKHPL